MALPREPRQKMINMMYLVLTALLALNVSSEILNAFKTVNRSLETTNATVDKSSQNVMASLLQKTTEPATAEKARIWYPKAQLVQGYAKTAYTYIQGIKDNILTKAGGDPKNPNKRYKEDNLDITTRMMVDKGEGKRLYAQLDQFRKNILAVDPEVTKEFSASLPIDLTPPKTKGKSWEYAYFHMVPTVAALTILSKFQNDVKTSENKVLQYCHNKVGEVIVVFDTYAAFAQTNSSYVMPGDEMEITAGVGAFSKAAKPIITIEGQNVPLDVDGAAHRKLNAATSIGDHTVNVTVEFVDQEGKKQTITKPIKYTVGQSAASIALDKMNVLYIGVENPVSISATGGGAELISVSMTGGGNGSRIDRKPGGGYIAKVTSVNDECWINVSVDGRPAGKSKFRVRTVPEAQAYVGGQPSGAQMTAGQFKAQGGVGAGIKNFPFELSYDVLSYTFTCDTDDDIVSIPANGALFSGAVRKAIDQHVKPDRMVTIDNIRVKGPDGRTTTAPSLIYYIN